MQPSNTPNSDAIEDAVNQATATPGRHITLESFADMEWDIPTWAWEPEHNGQSIGAIPLGAMTMFAGRPGAGKSSAGRYFAAQVTRGTLPGHWYGTPQKVAYLAGEESLKYNVLPSLIASGADTSMMIRPKVTFVTPDGKTEIVGMMPNQDMRDLTEQFIDAGVKLVVVDPLMEYMGTDIDVYKNNEVRAKIKPWAKLAEDIDGVVIAIMHLNKSGNGDVVAGINGSSAFGEVARAVFGFAIDPDDEDGDRIMSQEKNSIGVEGAAWVYRMEGKLITNSEGKTGDFGTFQLIGDSDRTVGEVLRDSSASRPDDSGDLKSVVLDFLESSGGIARVSDIQKEVRDSGHNFKTAQNQKGKWGIKSCKPEGVWSWELTAPTSHPTPTPLGTRDVGTLGSSLVTGGNQHPEPGNIPTSQDPTPIRGHDPREDEALNAVLESLSPEYGMSAKVIEQSVPLVHRTQVPEILDQLTTDGFVIQDGAKYLLPRKATA